MKTELLWHELKTRAGLLQPTDRQLTAMDKLQAIAVATTPESTAGFITVEKDVDGDLVILLQEGMDGNVVVNGTWGKLVIEDDGFVTLTGTGLDEPLTGNLG